MSEGCAKRVWHGYSSYPCSRKAVKDGFCKQHHPDPAAERQRKSEAAYAKRVANSAPEKLRKARERIAKLEEALEKYGDHLYFCTDEADHCVCGFDEAMRGGSKNSGGSDE